jgi:hypothetical protein
MQHLRRTRHNGQAVSSRVGTRHFTDKCGEIPATRSTDHTDRSSESRVDCHGSNMPACQICRSSGALPNVFDGDHVGGTGILWWEMGNSHRPTSSSFDRSNVVAWTKDKDYSRLTT